jgi:hypothetical protein
LKKFSTYDLPNANKYSLGLTIMLSSKDNNFSILGKQFTAEDENRCELCNTITTITCINCSVGVCVEHWNTHVAEVHMKGISLRNIFKEATAVHDGLDLKTCLKYMFKKL